MVRLIMIKIDEIIWTTWIGYTNRITCVSQRMIKRTINSVSLYIISIIGYFNTNYCGKTAQEKYYPSNENLINHNETNSDNQTNQKYRFAQTFMQRFYRLLSLITMLTISRSVIRWRFIRGWWYIRHTILPTRLYNVSFINSVRHFFDLTTLPTVSLLPLIMGAVA